MTATTVVCPTLATALLGATLACALPGCAPQEAPPDTREPAAVPTTPAREPDAVPTSAPSRVAPPPEPPFRLGRLPEPKTEQGRCWVRLQRLEDDELGLTRRAFLQRNPGWTLKPINIDPFTGLVLRAHYFRKARDVAEVATLSHDEYQRRRVEVLRRNADLIGMSLAEIDALEWGAGEFVGSHSNLMGSMPRAHVRRLAPRFAAMGDRAGGWSVNVHFQRDGVVSGFSVSSTGPPVPICTTPRINAKRARAARGIVDASAQPASLGYFAPGFTVAPHEIGNAKLSVSMYMAGGPRTRATSVTWRLVWGVSVREGLWTFLVDAVSGEVTGLLKNFMT